MPIISSRSSNEKEKIKIALDKKLTQEIKDYMAWADINDISFFFEEAAQYVLSKDKEWKAHKKNSSVTVA